MVVAQMRLVVLDFETFFRRQATETEPAYTLSIMSTEAYIRDPRFKAHGAAIKWSTDTRARWYNEPQLRWVLQNEDWSDTLMVHHHAQFDSLIESHHYNVHPARIGCTLSMARLMLGNHLSVSLDSVRKHFGMPLKLTPYNLMDGRIWEQMSHETQQLVAEGAIDEVESIWQIFHLFMSQGFPIEELRVIDTTIKMFTEPLLRADIDLLAKIWEDENNKKDERLAALNVTKTDLASADKFAELLRAEGIEPETKQGKNDAIYAFAKTDDFMRGLLDHDNERVRTLAEARLGEKSTLMQTRAATMGWMARRGPLCVYLRYAGAGTLRVSGGDGANWLNFKRQSPLRKTIMAPDGYVLAPVDASQIECRVLHYLAGGPNEPVIQKFRNKEDPYVDLAGQFYKERIYKPRKGDPRFDEMESKRGMGKQGRLMCGYGAAGLQFKVTAKNGLYGPPVDISIEDATAFVKLYRETNPSVCGKAGYWAQGEWALSRLAAGVTTEWGPLTIKNKRIYLPGGQPVIYDTLEWHIPDSDENCRDFERSGYWRMRTRNGWKKMWGSKIVQNMCEAVSRVIVSQAMNRITAMGYRVLNWPYDELLMLIPKDGREEKHAERCAAEMKIAPDWLPGLPLDAEWSLGERYSK
jgi:hypothetical protein